MVTQNYLNVSSSVNTISKRSDPTLVINWQDLRSDTGEDAQVQTVVNSQYVT